MSSAAASAAPAAASVAAGHDADTGAHTGAHIRVSVPTGAFTRNDGAMDDDFKTWVLTCLVATDTFKPRAGLWYTGDSDAAFAKTSVTNGCEPAYNYARQSKSLRLSADVLTELATTSLVLAAFRGGNRDATKDQLIGWYMLDLGPVLAGEKVKGTFKLHPGASLPAGLLSGATVCPVAYEARVTVEARVDAAIEEACIGSRIFTIPQLTLRHIPRRWRLPASDAEEDTPEEASAGSADAATAAAGHDPATLVAMCNDPDDNPYRYVLSLELPAAMDAATGGITTRTVHLSSGTLRYTQDGDAGAAGAWRWSVAWKATKLFMDRGAVGGLGKLVTSGRGLRARLRRVLTEVVDDDDPVDTVFSLEPGRRLLEEDYSSRADFELNLDELVAAGATTTHLELNVTPEPVSEAEKSADATAKAARDAAWAEHLTAKAKAGGGKGGAKSKAGGGAKAGKTPAKDAKPKADSKAAKAKDDKKAKAGKAGDKKEAERDDEMPAAPPPHPYIGAGTLMNVHVALNAALTPRPPTPPPVQLTATDLVPPRGPAPALPPGLDASQEFRREVANAATEIAKEYAAVAKRLAATHAGVPEDVRRKELLVALKTSGVYERMKAKFKTVASKIVQERFVGMPGSDDAPGTRGKDMFITHVYAYLVGQMHAALNATFAEAEAASALAPLAAVAPSAVGAPASTKDVADKVGKDLAPRRQRLRSIAEEAEFAGQTARAAKVHQTIVSMQEEAAAFGKTDGSYDATAWYDYGTFAVRSGELLRAYTLLREAVGSDSNHVPSLLAISAVQLARGVPEQAVAFALSAVNACSEDDNFVGVAAVAHMAHAAALTANGRAVDAGKALHAAVGAYADILRQLQLPEDEIERSATVGAVYLAYARFLLTLNLHQLARAQLALAADNIADTDAPRSQRVDLLVLRARQYMQAGNMLRARECNTAEAASKPASAAPRRADSVSPRAEHDGRDEAQPSDAVQSKSSDVSVSASGSAYDGAVINARQCRQTLERAIEMDAKNSEAWYLRAVLFACGRANLPPEDEPAAPSDGMPELADISRDDLTRCADFLRLATGHYIPPLPFDDSVSADFAVTSASGLGGARVCEAGNPLTHMYMLLAAVQLQLASVASDPATSPALNAARDAYLRAANTSKQSDARQPWALALLGVGRTLWVQQDYAAAESVLSEANVVDNQNPVIWGWLALLCLRARPVRDREAATAMDQAIKLGLYGDTLESAELLQLLADRYLDLGQAPVAINLLRRALTGGGATPGPSLIQAKLEARVALGNALLESGAVEDAIAQFKHASEAALPSVSPALTGAAAAVDGIRQIRKGAAHALGSASSRLAA